MPIFTRTFGSDGRDPDDDRDPDDELEAELATDLDDDLDPDDEIEAELAAEFDDVDNADGAVGVEVNEELAADIAEAAADEGGVTDSDAQLAELAAERDEFKDLALRVRAEFDNYRKRSATQQSDAVDRATGALAEALLPVLDAAESAYVAHPDEVGPLFNLLLAELRKRGLEPMNLLDQTFDPNLADAVAHEPGDGAEPRAAEVLRSGYTWKGKTLRAAMVRTTD